MDYKDYYKILGIERSASDQEIKKVYRKLAMKYHPDRNQGDKQAEDKFKEINEAYQVLSDSTKRSRYDQLGDSYFNYQQHGGAPNGFNWDQWYAQTGGGQSRRTRVDVNDLGDLFGGASSGGFSDFFRMIFGEMGGASGGRRTSSGPASQQQVEQPISISLMEAYTGTTRIIQSGSRRLEVKIPKGAKTGTKVRVPAGSAPGMTTDVYLVVDIPADPRYERKDNDLYTDGSIDVYTAILGGQTNILTPAGNVTLTIPAGTQPGQTFRLAGRGMPVIKAPTTFGDLYVRARVIIPRTLTEQEKELFTKLAKRKE